MSESFEKWWSKVPAEYTDVVNEDVARSAHTAGLLRAAEIADETEEGCGYGCPNIIADAIRKEVGNDLATD